MHCFSHVGRAGDGYYGAPNIVREMEKIHRQRTHGTKARRSGLSGEPA